MQNKEKDLEQVKSEEKGKQLFICFDKNGNPTVYQKGLSYIELLGLANYLEFIWRLEVAEDRQPTPNNKEEIKK